MATTPVRRSSRKSKTPKAFVAGSETGEFHEGVPKGLLTSPSKASASPSTSPSTSDSASPAAAAAAAAAPMASLPAILYRMFEPGASLHWLEWIVFYSLPIFFYSVAGAWGKALTALFEWNAMCQLVVFTLVVQIPTFVTGKMSYVDIGWPMGLVVLAANLMLYGPASLERRLVVGVPLMLHGGRMFLGALAMFFPYVFKEDLSRYQYAKVSDVVVCCGG